MNFAPRNVQKYLYIEKTPTWKVRSIYIFGIISWLLVVYGFRGMIFADPFYTWFVTPILILITFYHLLSFGINAFYKRFNIGQHIRTVDKFWDNNKEPSVDIFLPICGESLDVLNNTWYHIHKLVYKNKKVYVLDDSIEEAEEHRKLAEEYGFQYFERPNKGENKKAGNLKYAFERTNSDFIAIFDADFAPHPDFLYETIPYTAEKNIGIVQTPQYFDTSKNVYKKSPLAYCAAYQEEFFYRIMQVAKDRFNAAICCGSNAVYRRKALDSIGGPRQVTASEDSRTGFALLSKGWITRYIPVILALGICPDNVYAYYHQQHRWCRGRSELVLSKEFRNSSVPLLIKITNTTGFLSFLLRPLEIMLTFQLFWLLFLYNDFLSYGNSVIFYLYLLFSFILIPLFHITKFKKEVLLASSIQAYASTHSIISVLMGKSVGWIATNARHTSVSPAFRQTTFFVSIYISLYILLILLGIRTGDIRLFDFKYWSIQFWIFYNLLISGLLLFQLLKTINQMKMKKINEQVNYYFNSTKIIEILGILGLGYLFFEVLFSNLGFIFGLTVNKYTLLTSYILYTLIIIGITTSVRHLKAERLNLAVSTLLFVLISFTLVIFSSRYVSKTYDTSWDGQGYHSNGVISLALGWNPISDKELPINFPDGSIFVKGYPKALWTVQSSIYSATGSLDSAKITNIAIVLLAITFSFTLLRKLKLPIVISFFLSLFLTLQPPYIIQIFSFSEDLFSYGLIIIATSTLGIFALERDINKAFITFVIAELFLIGTKYSNIPVVAALGIIFIGLLCKQYLKFKQVNINIMLFYSIFISGLIFLMVPYATNAIHYRHLLYPSNLEGINSSYKEDNIPKNLVNSNSLELIFYSIFSKSQTKSMGKDNPANIAELKLPFTFTKDEIRQSASIFNNRVGAGGPLFSGIILASALLILLMLIINPINKSITNYKRIYVFGLIGTILFLTIVNPVPNLLRYNTQIVFIPFIVIISTFILYKNSKFLRTYALIIVTLLFINTYLYTDAVLNRRLKEIIIINTQINNMKLTSSSFAVSANNFYSNYIRLLEHNITIEAHEELECDKSEVLLYSHNTTMLCKLD